MINLVDFLRFSWVWERNSRRIPSLSGGRRRGAVEGAAGRMVIAPRGRGMRGAHAHSAQALGAAGPRCKAPRGLQVREHFWGFLDFVSIVSIRGLIGIFLGMILGFIMMLLPLFR